MARIPLLRKLCSNAHDDFYRGSWERERCAIPTPNHVTIVPARASLFATSAAPLTGWLTRPTLLSGRSNCATNAVEAAPLAMCLLRRNQSFREMMTKTQSERNKRRKAAWEMFCEGLKPGEISSRLKLNVNTVYNYIKFAQRWTKYRALN